jgi:hypothetical protein
VTLSCQLEEALWCEDQAGGTSLSEARSVRGGKALSVRDGRYLIEPFGSPYGGELSARTLVFSKRGISIEPGFGDAHRAVLSMTMWINDEVYDAVEDDPEIEDDFIKAIAKKLKVSPRSLSWDPSWLPNHTRAGGWSRDLNYHGKVVIPKKYTEAISENLAEPHDPSSGC